jgi:hypothetical protein
MKTSEEIVTKGVDLTAALASIENILNQHFERYNNNVPGNDNLYVKSRQQNTIDLLLNGETKARLTIDHWGQHVDRD